MRLALHPSLSMQMEMSLRIQGPMRSCYCQLHLPSTDSRQSVRIRSSTAQPFHPSQKFSAAGSCSKPIPRRFQACRQMGVRCQAAEAPVQVAEPPSPNVFDGTTRLYFSPMCPYAQRVSIAVNYKGLDEIERVEINLANKPTWFKEKVYPPGKVPALEHEGTVKGESLDLLAYLDEHFPGPLLQPQDEERKVVAKELIGLCDAVVKTGYMALSEEDLTGAEIEARFSPLLQELEEALGRFPEGPFFLGEFGIVDCVYIPFFERFVIAYTDIHKSAYDVTTGRPNLARWLQAVEGVEAYVSTKVERERIRKTYEQMLGRGYFKRIFSAGSEQAQGGSTS